jgi:hypothetical protein
MMINRVVQTFSIWVDHQIKQIKVKIGIMEIVQKEQVLKK